MNPLGSIEIVSSSSRHESGLASAPFSGILFEPAYADCYIMKRLIKPTLLLAIVALFLFGYVLHFQSEAFREFQLALLSADWMLLACVALWCGTFLFLTFSRKDLPLIGLLLIAIAAYFIGYAASRPATDALILLTGVTLGRGASVLLGRSSRRESAPTESGIDRCEPGTDQRGPTSAATFLMGLVVLLAFSSWWHLNIANNFYHGPRWMGLWNNPNDYGLLMAAGVVLATGLLAASLKSRVHSPKSEGEKQKAENGKWKQVESADGQDWRRFFYVFNLRKSAKSAEENVSGGPPDRTRGLRVVPILLFIAAGMMGTGLVFSYSRGAWVATAIGLLYLASAYGKFKWRYVVLGAGLVALGALLIWGRTPDDAPWYFQRLDLSRGSVQHRIAAWRTGFEMMRDHPFGVGWNKAVRIYVNDYSPPEGGAVAITTNDYLMLGTQLGLPGLLCFVVYVALCLGAPASRRQVGSKAEPAGETPALPAICRAGALAMLVAFWFDGGLFKLATASVFWILLELGMETQKQKAESGNAEIDLNHIASTSAVPLRRTGRLLRNQRYEKAYLFPIFPRCLDCRRHFAFLCRARRLGLDALSASD